MSNTYSLIMQDLKRFGDKPSTRSLLLGWPRIFTSHSFKVTFWFRIGSHCLMSRNFFCKLFYPFIKIIYIHVQYLTGITLPLGTKIGGGLMFPHFSGIIIHYDAVIGENCTIHQCVTVGTERAKIGAPVIGNNCVLGTGCKIIGSMHIGNNVMVGANAVVTKDCPDNAVVVGIPATILNMKGEYYTSLR